MGRKLVLNGTKITDTTAPKLTTIDRMETHGSLLLVDPTHPLGSWSAGVPAGGSTVPNLLAPQAAAILGTSAATSHNLGIVSTRMTDSVHGKLERTPKGGVHAIYSPSNPDNATANSTFFRIDLTSAQRAYLAANPGHSIYASTWVRITRGATGTGGANGVLAMVATSAATSNHWMYFGQNGVTGPANKTAGEWRTPTAVGSHLLAGAGPFKNSTGTTMATASNVEAFAFQVGNQGFLNAAAATNAPSAVFYRAYVEDLTVSGRTYADVLALDQELYNREVLTTGGRYYGDTVPTAPSTIP